MPYEQQNRQTVRDKIAIGVAEIDRGEELNGDEVFRKLFARLGLPFPAAS